MNETNDTIETQLTCVFCDKPCKSPVGLASHERHCKANPENEKVEDKKPLPARSLTAEESAIVSRVQGEDVNWFNLSDSELNDFSLMADPLLLPPEAQRLQNEKKYCFRWCERTAKRIDELCKSQQPPLRWAIVNRSNLPALSDQVDDILGCVCRLDQALLFKPWHHHQLVKDAKRALAENLDKSGQLDAFKDKAPDGVEIFTGERGHVKGGDDIQFDESIFDGGAEDTSDLGDLVVDE